MNKKKNEKGQSTLEYIVISFLIGIGCLAGMKSLGSKLNVKLKTIRSQINTQLKL